MDMLIKKQNNNFNNGNLARRKKLRLSHYLF